MELHSVRIGNLQTDNNIFLAPLAGYTDCVFRNICLDFGAGLTFTEMVSAKGLKYDSEKTKQLLVLDRAKIHAVQLFGSEPDTLRMACESVELKDYQIVDLNMGCPVPKIYKNGEGSALMQNPALAEKIISECQKSGKIVTVKFRIGIDDDNLITQDFAKMCEGAGASLITIHGRTKKAVYSGEPNFNEIAKAKHSVNIPVIANGGVFSQEDCKNMLNKTGADGIMIARASLFNPFVFSELVYGKKKTEWDIKQTILNQIDGMLEVFDEHTTLVQMRKMCTFYLKGKKGCNKYKTQLFACPTTVALKQMICDIFKEVNFED